jgi:hypothetical protein
MFVFHGMQEAAKLAVQSSLEVVTMHVNTDLYTVLGAKIISQSRCLLTEARSAPPVSLISSAAHHHQTSMQRLPWVTMQKLSETFELELMPLFGPKLSD